MSRLRPLPHARLLQRFGATRAGARVYARTLVHLDRASYRLSGGRVMITGLISGLPVGVLQTTGARSGQPRSVPLIFVPDPDEPDVLAVLGTNYGRRPLPAWVHNLRAHPDSNVVLGGEHRPVTAHETSGPAYDRWWQLAEQTYVGYPAYRRRLNGARPIPIFALRPRLAPPAG